MDEKKFPNRIPDLEKLPAVIPKRMLAIVVFAALNATSQKINPWIARELEADWKLTGPRLLVIGMLSRTGGMRMGELAEALDLSPRAISRLVDGLEESGYVTRRQDETDRRVFHVSLTEAAEEAAGKLVPLHDARIVNLFSEFSAKELRLLAKALGKLIRALGR